MQHKKIHLAVFAAGILLIAATGLWLSTVPASAQCGSQASSCKNCHEVQGQLSVNSDGNGWHTSHAFGDFCYICHAGNNQAQGITEAHTGMVPPLSDIKASCLQCHPDDLQARAQVYADALGVEITSGEPAPTGGTSPSSSETASVSTAAGVPVVTELDIDDPNLVDYVQRYNQIVLGKKTINLGNAVLVGLIGLVAMGGSGFIIKNEGWLDFSSINSKKADEEYTAEVVELLPLIEGLKPELRKSLGKILKNPDALEDTLKTINTAENNEWRQEEGK